MTTQTYARPLIAEIRSHGVTQFSLEHGGKHLRLKFSYCDQHIVFVFPASPSDQRGVHNALSDLRRKMGVRRVVHKSARPRRGPNGGGPSGAPASPVPLVITVKPNPFDQLAPLLAQLRGGSSPASATSLVGG